MAGKLSSGLGASAASQSVSKNIPSIETSRQQDANPDNTTAPNNVVQRGVVHEWRPGSATVMVRFGQHQAIEPAFWAVGAIHSSLLGLRTNFHPEPGTEVLVLRTPETDQNFVIATIPHPIGRDESNQDASSDQTVFDTEVGQRLAGDSNLDRGDATPKRDRVFGEYDLTTAHGVGLSVLQNLTRLGASELSMIEFHMLDDLTRVVSENYEHISALGDFSIRNDGSRPTAIWRGSSKLHETEGRDSPQGVEHSAEDPFTDGARRRFEIYLGHLGNILHMFVHDPAESVGQLAAGRFRAHVNEDGSLLVQSVADIIFEKVVVIQVPAAQYTADDPEGDHLDELEYQPDPHLRTWIAESETDVFLESYKLRDYARWMNNWFSLAQFHRSKRDYQVPTESEAPQPSLDNVDVERPNSGAAATHEVSIQTYATMRIFRDGSILHQDGYGSTVHMAGGDVTLSAAKNLRLESAGDTTITAGRDLIVKTFRHIDMVSATGGFTLRAKRWLRALVTAGQLSLESSATTGQIGDETSGSDSTNAVVIRAKNGTAMISALGRLALHSATSAIVSRCALPLVMFANGLLIRATSNRLIASLSPNGALACGEIRSASTVRAESIRVKNRLPIPDASGDPLPNLSAVYHEDPYITPEPIHESMELIAPDELTFAADADSFPPNSQVTFVHHEEYSTVPTLRSITQTLLLSAPPPGIASFDYQADFSAAVFNVFNVPGDVSPGPGSDERVATGRSPALHQRATARTPFNRGKALTTEDWEFTRLDEE